ncbi:hypothetical protein Moror_17918 [Moniliophthora roreri MCA 2997]|uniref:Mid2 domain-containing protein n=2 Tax=Moniliophthora roreri TaxID=221103 RepID=V2XDF7_MONRO|nr:hypothetical protein Moror_17918 [Moniliophthora roreri MCA 2997]KAI3619163.1 hypothetical protein WG66_012889 [Moniliophthora roreri]
MYISLGLALTILYFYAIEPFAFELQVPTDITAQVPSRFNWTRQSNDTLPIGINIGNKGDCSKTVDPNTRHPFIWKIDLNASNGSKQFYWNWPGQIQLCAYSYAQPLDGQGDTPKDVRLIASSANITVSLVQPTVIFTTNTIIGPTSSGQGIAATTSATEARRHISKGGIASIVLGIIVILGLFIGLFVVYRRLRNRKRLHDFHRERMVLAAQASRVASPDMVIPRKHVSATLSDRTSVDHSQSAPYYTFPGEKNGQKSYGEDVLAPVRLVRD